MYEIVEDNLTRLPLREALSATRVSNFWQQLIFDSPALRSLLLSGGLLFSHELGPDYTFDKHSPWLVSGTNGDTPFFICRINGKETVCVLSADMKRLRNDVQRLRVVKYRLGYQVMLQSRSQVELQ